MVEVAYWSESDRLEACLSFKFLVGEENKYLFLYLVDLWRRNGIASLRM